MTEPNSFTLAWSDELPLMEFFEKKSEQAKGSDSALAQLHMMALLSCNALAKVAVMNPERVAELAEKFHTWPINASMEKSKLKQDEELFAKLRVGKNTFDGISPYAVFKNQKIKGEENVAEKWLQGELEVLDGMRRIKDDDNNEITELPEVKELLAFAESTPELKVAMSLPKLTNETKDQWWECIKGGILRKTGGHPELIEELSGLVHREGNYEGDRGSIKRADILKRLKECFSALVNRIEKTS